MRRWFLICSILFLLLFTACKVDNLVSQGTIRFNPNGGSGYMASQTVFAGQPQKLYTNAYTRDDYYFLGWNTQKDGAGTFYKENETYTYDGKEPEMNLYAQWKKGEGTYSICFVDLMNGFESKTIEVPYGEEYRFPSIKTLFIHENVFMEWNTASDGSGYTYANEAVVKNLAQPGRTVYLYARWEIEISYDPNNGHSTETVPPSIIVKSFDKVTLFDGSGFQQKKTEFDDYSTGYPKNLMPYHVFRGWCTDPSCCDGTVYIKENGVIEGTAPSKDTTLYGVWGYNYRGIDYDPCDYFGITRGSVITHCEQLIVHGLIHKDDKTDVNYLYDSINGAEYVVIASGPLYVLENPADPLSRKEVTKKVGTGRYSYVVFDEEKINYASFVLSDDPNYFIKDNDTDVLVIFMAIYHHSIVPLVLPSREYMSSWGNPVIRAPGDQVDPLLFRAILHGSPDEPHYYWSSTQKTSVSNPEFYYVTSYNKVGEPFWHSITPGPETKYFKVLTALF